MKPRRRVVLPAGEVHPVGHTELARLRLERFAQRPVAENGQAQTLAGQLGGQLAEGLDQRGLAFDVDQPAGGDDQPVFGLQRELLPQGVLRLGVERLGRVGEIGDVMYMPGRQAALDHPVAQAFGVADPGVGVAEGRQLVIAAQARQMHLAATALEVGEAGGAAHIGLHDGRVAGRDEARELPARERVPHRAHGRLAHVDAVEMVAGEVGVASHDHFHRFAVAGHGAHEAHQPALGAAHLLAAEDVQGFHCASTLL